MLSMRGAILDCTPHHEGGTDMVQCEPITIDDIDEIETLIAVHGTAHCLDLTGHVCFAVAAALASIHSN